MAIVSLQDVYKAYGPQVVLDGVSLQVEDGERIGLIGANGSGKSTILRIIAGEVDADSGIVQRKKGLTVGHVHQDPDLSEHGALHDFVRTAFDDLETLQRQMLSAEADLHALPPGGEHDRTAHRLAELHDQFNSRGGYAYASRIDEVLSGLGFPQSSFRTPCDRLSGGERTRAAIAHAILAEPDLLLLDEPTNHLDLDATRWLETFLQRYRRAAIVVSHDRYFLDKTAGRIIEVEGGRVQCYKGNYSDYLLQKDEQLKARRREFVKQQAFVAKEEEFIRRNLAGQRTKEAQGRRKRLERLDRLDRPGDAARQITVDFQPETRGPNLVLRLRGLGKRFEARTLFSGLDLDLLFRERLGVIGPSGAGKTTLVRIILGLEQPSEGEAALGRNLSVGYHAQHRIDLDPQAAVIDELYKVRPKAEETALRTFIGRFLFTGEDIRKSVGSLSGGEQTRLALAKLILSGPNFLVLDEPTNHLDLPSRAALEQALHDYAGTVLVVTHDRYLLRNLATGILLIAGGSARKFAGGYAAFEARIAAEQALAAPKPRAGKKQAPPGQARRVTAAAARKMSLDDLERTIIRVEAEMESLMSQLDDPLIYEHPGKARVLQKSYREKRSELDRLNRAWDAMVDAASADGGEC